MNAMQRKVCEQIKVMGNHRTVDQFVDSHKPFGWDIWQSLLNDKFVYEDKAGHVTLTLHGEQSLLVLR